jgi:hypothetical protein
VFREIKWALSATRLVESAIPVHDFALVSHSSNSTPPKAKHRFISEIALFKDLKKRSVHAFWNVAKRFPGGLFLRNVRSILVWMLLQMAINLSMTTVTMKDGPHIGVPISITIFNQRAMSIWIDPSTTNNHFGNAPIYETVDLII